MARNKESQNKVFEEIQKNIKQDLSTKDLSTLSYTKACITETYRLTPTAFCLARVLETDMDICGYTLPTGVSIFN